MKKLASRILCVVYLLSIIVYINQGQLYGGSIFTFLAAGVVYMCSLLSWFYYFAAKVSHSIINNIICLISFFFFIYLFSASDIFVPYIYEKVSTISFCSYSFLILSSTTASYILTKLDILNERMLFLFGICFLSLGIMNLLYFMDGADIVEFTRTNNYGYNVVAIVPMLPLMKKKKYIYLLLLVVLMIAIMSLKRGAIFILGLCTLYILFFQLFVQSKKGLRVLFRNIIYIILLLIMFSYVIMDIYNNSVGLSLRIEETLDGNSSSRDFIYSKIFESFLDSNIIHIFFGHGVFETVRVVGNYAHCDYLEILYDFGIIGLIIFVMLYIKIWHVMRCHIKDYQLKCILGVVICFLFTKSLFSMCIYDFNSIPAYIMLGYVLGKMNKQYRILV